MAGLRLGVNGVIQGSSPSYSSVGAQAPTVTEAAFGMGNTSAAPSTFETLKPNNGFGFTFWGGIVAVGLLIMVRRSLPN